MDVELLILDVDGVLTDGAITLDPQGRELKTFSSRDGFGVKLWQRMGFHVAIISGRASEAVAHRARELGVEHVMLGCRDKGAALHDLAKKSGVSLNRMAALADDWPDLPILRRVGYPMAVADAAPEVIAAARHTTAAPGGRGAVREAIEHLLDRAGLLGRARAEFAGGQGSCQP